MLSSLAARWNSNTTPVTHLPVNNHRGLGRFLTDLIRCDVVPQSIEGPADEGRLLVEALPERGQALRW